MGARGPARLPPPPISPSLSLLLSIRVAAPRLRTTAPPRVARTPAASVAPTLAPESRGGTRAALAEAASLFCASQWGPAAEAEAEHAAEPSTS